MTRRALLASLLAAPVAAKVSRATPRLVTTWVAHDMAVIYDMKHCRCYVWTGSVWEPFA